MRTFATLVLMAGLVAAVGCGDGRPTCYPVHGQVTAPDGKPAAGALVVFHPISPPAGPTLAHTATADEAGRFAVTTFDSGDGAPAGEYVLTVIWNTPKKTLMDQEKDRLNGRYANKDASKLKFTIEKKSDNEMPPIALK